MIEYMVVESGTDLASEGNLNELAEDSWMLVTVVQKDSVYFWHLMREKEEH